MSEERTALKQESLLLDWLVALQRGYVVRAGRLPGRRVYNESAAVSC